MIRSVQIESPSQRLLFEDVLPSSGAAESAKARSVAEQTGWKRPAPCTILTNTSTLLKITDYDFDMSAAGFEEYAERRGVLSNAGIKGSGRWNVVMDHSWTKERFMSSDVMRDNREAVAKGWAGSGGQPLSVRIFTDEERELSWKVILIAKAHLQDCWEVWLNLRGEAA